MKDHSLAFADKIPARIYFQTWGTTTGQRSAYTPPRNLYRPRKFGMNVILHNIGTYLPSRRNFVHIVTKLTGTSRGIKNCYFYSIGFTWLQLIICWFFGTRGRIRAKGPNVARVAPLARGHRTNRRTTRSSRHSPNVRRRSWLGRGRVRPVGEIRVVAA